MIIFENGTCEYGLKTGDLPEKELVRLFEQALSRAAGEIGDPRIPQRRKLRRSTGPFGRDTPEGEPPEYDHIYIYDHRPSNLFLRLYPNREKNGRVKYPEEGIVWVLYVTILAGYPPRMFEDDRIQEFGVLAMEELFQLLPGEKVLLRRIDFQ